MEILFAFVGIIFVKFFINLSKLITAKKLRTKYEKSFVSGGPSFNEYIPQTRKLLADANLDKASIAVSERLGNFQVASFTAKVSDNLDSRRADFVSSTITLLDQTVGVFRMRMMESISPRYWIEAIIFLPRNAIKYLGGKPSSFSSKLLQVIYWVLTPILVAFRSDIYNFIIELIGKAQ